MAPSCSYLLVPSFPITGKVHGSLARAGKVRGQTPKVSESISGRGVWTLSFPVTAKSSPWVLTRFAFSLPGDGLRERMLGVEDRNQGLINPPFFRWPNRRRRRRRPVGLSAGCSTTGALSTLCPPLARRRAPMPILKSFVIAAFSNKKAT